MNFFTGFGLMPGSDSGLRATHRNLQNSGQSGFWGGNNGYWANSDGDWYAPGWAGNSMMGGMGMGMGMGAASLGAGYAPIGYEDLMPRVDPFGIYRLYAHHADEVVLSIRDPDTSSHRDNFTVVDRATGTILFRVKESPYSPTEKRNVYDMSGNWLFQIRRKGLPFTNDTWVGLDPISQRTIFSVSSKYGVQGGLGITFLNTAGKGEQSVIRIGADLVGRCIPSDGRHADSPSLTVRTGHTIHRLARTDGCQDEQGRRHYVSPSL